MISEKPHRNTSFENVSESQEFRWARIIEHTNSKVHEKISIDLN